MENFFVTSEFEIGVEKITFFHPQSNSLPSDLLNEIVTKIEEAGKNEDVKVILLNSAGDGAFCAGASFDELLSIRDFESSKKFFLGFANVINAIRKVPKFVVLKVQGKCVGGGVGIAAAADYTFALDRASVKLSELSIGIGPLVIGPAVERKIGVSAFSQLAINATQWKSAAWAKEKGLYMDVYSTEEELNEAIGELLNNLSTSSLEAMKELKTMFWKGTENWQELLLQRAEIVGKLAMSDSFKNSIKRFKKQ